MKKGFVEWVEREKPDILMLQETKAEREQLPDELVMIPGYHSYWSHSTRKKGYSGTAIYSKFLPGKISSGLGHGQFDTEGRTLVAEYGDLIIFNIYFPNGKASPERLQHKMEFYEAFQERAIAEVKRGKQVLVGGDVNTAHHPIDLARPHENEDISGFLPMERAWMDRFEADGFIDTFRHFHPDEKDQYSWWSMRSGARARNVGWRIDYWYASANLKSHIKDAFILPHVYGSDHCPVGVVLDVPKHSLYNSTVQDPERLAGDADVQASLL